MKDNSTVVVLAGGPSIRDFPAFTIQKELTKRAFVIGVNDSAYYAEADVAISMDRLWTEHRWRHLTDCGVPMVIRYAALKNVPPHDLIAGFHCDHKSHTMNLDLSTNILNGTNSGMCALNLAARRPYVKRVFVLGLDTERKQDAPPYWYPPYSWAPEGATKLGKYDDWRKQYTSIAKQFDDVGIQVYTVGRSSLRCFKNISFKLFMGYLNDGSDKNDLPVLQQSADAGAAG